MSISAALSPSSTTHRWPSTGLTLSALMSAVDDEGPQKVSLADVYGRAFFVRHALAQRQRLAPMRTELGLTDDDEPERERTGEIVLLVMPVLRAPHSEHPFVSIGRLEGNDIAIPDETMSKFHAYVQLHDGDYVVQDGRSRNGTTVDGVPVAARGFGPPTPLRPGAVVRFGSVTTSFLDDAGVIALAKRLWRR